MPQKRRGLTRGPASTPRRPLLGPFSVPKTGRSRTANPDSESSTGILPVLPERQAGSLPSHARQAPPAVQLPYIAYFGIHVARIGPTALRAPVQRVLTLKSAAQG